MSLRLLARRPGSTFRGESAFSITTARNDPDVAARTQANAIQEKSFAFAIRVVNAYRYLSTTHREHVLSKQMLRSGTGIGALVREAEEAESRSDFIHKLRVALKEAAETEYWLLLLRETGFLAPHAFSSLHSDLLELLRLLTSIINTTRRKN